MDTKGCPNGYATDRIIHVSDKFEQCAEPIATFCVSSFFPSVGIWMIYLNDKLYR